MSTALSGAFLIGVSLTGFASPDAARANAVDAVAAIEKVAPEAVRTESVENRRWATPPSDS